MRAGVVLAVESRTGLPLRDSVIAAMDEHGTVDQAAAALEIHPNTLRKWIKLMRLRRTYTTEPEAS